MPPANAMSAPSGREGDRTSHYKQVTIAALVLIAIGCTVGTLVPAGRGWDFANFYEAGHRAASGQSADLYRQEGTVSGHAAPGTMRFWSAPLSAFLFAPLALLRPDVALVVFKLQNIAAVAAALMLLYRHGRRFIGADAEEGSAFAAVFASACLIYQPFWTVFRVGGQSTPTVLLLLVIALFCLMKSRLLTAAVLLVGAVMIKPGLVVMLAFLAFASGAPVIGALVASGTCLGLVSVAAMGWPIHLAFLRVLAEGGQFSRPWYFNSSLYVPIENLRLLVFTSDAAPRAAMALSGMAWGIKILVAVVLVTVLRRSHRQSWPLPARRHFEFMLAVCFWLMISQTIWEHYLAILFIPLAYLLAVRRRFPANARRLLGAILALSLGQNLIVMELLWTRFDSQSVIWLIAIGLFKAGPLLLTLIFLWRYQDSLFASYTAPEWARPRAVSPA